MLISVPVIYVASSDASITATRARGNVDIGENDDGAFVMETLGDRAADAAGCAGYDADLHVQSWHLGLEI